MKLNCEFFFLIVGGGGVGKSFVINLVAKWLELIFRQPGDDPSKPYILILAPTGMAATLIGKCTCTSFNKPESLIHNISKTLFFRQIAMFIVMSNQSIFITKSVITKSEYYLDIFCNDC